jgi:RHS repeat-associated protein
MDRVTGIANPDGSGLSYTYDSAGNRTGVTGFLANGIRRTTSSVYDDAGRMVGVTDDAGNTTSYAYDAAGRQTAIARPNGTTTTAVYDSMHRSSRIAHLAGASVLEQFDYLRSAVGDPTKVTQSDGRQATYAYDAARRLIAETHTDGVVAADRAYTYDPVSNRLSQTDAVTGVNTSYTYDADDRMLSAGAITFTYDGRGSQLSANVGTATTLYGYDSRGLLTSAALPDGTTVGYDVDAIGLRTAEDGIALLVDPLAPSGVAEVLLEHRDGQLLASYTYGTGLISVQRNGLTTYAHADEVGSIRLATDAGGAIVATADFTAFGEPLRSTGTMAWPNGFGGERRDADTGLSYLRARQYRASTGVFTTVDPDVGMLDDPRSRHPYLYADASPLSYTDPTGEFSVGIAEISVVSAIAAGISAAVFVPAATTAKERVQRAAVGAGLAVLSTIAITYLTVALGTVVLGSVFAAAGGGLAGLVVAFAVGVPIAFGIYITLSIFFGILSSCVATAGFEAKLCDLRAVAASNAVVALATLGIANRGGAAGPIAEKVVGYILNVLPPFASDFLGGKLASPS